MLPMKLTVATYRPFNPKAWLRLMRWPNLLIVGGTQVVAWWCVIYPLPGPKVLTPLNFFLLCISTMLIAAGGYIINDYFDIRIDVINKPDKVILERDIPRRLAIIVHLALNGIALALAAMVAFPAGHPEWLLLQLATISMLWRYSTTWKRQFVIGNIVVSLMTALTIIAIIIYEPVLRSLRVVIPGWHTIIGWPHSFTLIIFALFAFVLTCMREIVKDMEDYKGDDAEGCVTMPIRLGLLRSTRVVQHLGIMAILALCISVLALWRISNGVSWSACYILTFVIVPLALWIIQLPKAATSAHYHRASTNIKWIMVFGVSALLLLKVLNYG